MPPLHLPQLLGQFLARVALILLPAQPCLNTVWCIALNSGHAKPLKPESALSAHGTTALAVLMSGPTFWPTTQDDVLLRFIDLPPMAGSPITRCPACTRLRACALLPAASDHVTCTLTMTPTSDRRRRPLLPPPAAAARAMAVTATWLGLTQSRLAIWPLHVTRKAAAWGLPGDSTRLSSGSTSLALALPGQGLQAGLAAAWHVR